MSHPYRRTWVVLVPVKRTAVAKSRLTGASAPLRAELARAFPADCLAAALASPLVLAAVVVTDDAVVADDAVALGAEVLADTPDAGLNPALRHGARHVRRTFPDAPTAVLSGDLPALRAADLTTALRLASAHPRAFVADLAGTGTTMLTAAAGVDLDPRFGARSGAEHRHSGATELALDPRSTLRRDVDTDADLRAAVRLGVGDATQAVLRGVAPRLG